MADVKAAALQALRTGTVSRRAQLQARIKELESQLTQLRSELANAPEEAEAADDTGGYTEFQANEGNRLAKVLPTVFGKGMTYGELDGADMTVRAPRDASGTEYATTFDLNNAQGNDKLLARGIARRSLSNTLGDVGMFDDRLELPMGDINALQPPQIQALQALRSKGR